MPCQNWNYSELLEAIAQHGSDPETKKTASLLVEFLEAMEYPPENVEDAAQLVINYVQIQLTGGA